MKILLKHADILAGETWIRGGYLAVDGPVITAVSDRRPEGYFDCEKDMSGKLLLPGLVNTHTHAAMTLLRGVGTDLPLQEWLFDHVFPVEARLTAEDIRAGSALALLEMIAAGTTSFSDMYFHPEETAALVEQSGMKANLNYPVQAFDPKDTYEKNESARRLEALYRAWHGAADGRIRVDGCIHAEYTCNADVAAGTAAWCKSVGGRMHVHLSETQKEHEECLARWGKTPARWMADLGLFDVPCAAAHCVWVTEEDMALMAEKGVTAVHNPTSNMKLGSGFAPIPAMLERGIRVALGTDGAASNNNLNMLEELHLAAVLHDGYLRDTRVLPAAQALDLATRQGALAQGREDTGVLEAGKRADLIALDLEQPHLTPCLDAAGLVAYSAQGSDVCLTMVDGRILYENGTFLTLDAGKILAEARAAAKRLYA
jgi:5-methylthioadenosine/S-adenosylhomocysteine deaminase